MAANRWYYLRHPEGFSAELFECVISGLALWRTDIEARLRHWTQLGVGGVVPQYEWYAAELSDDKKLITIPVGGDGSYGSYHLLEETVPEMFRRYLPPWFVVDLETGRRDTAGWFPEITWVPCYPPDQRESARRVFRRPAEQNS
jgi:hypothetical protein